MTVFPHTILARQNFEDAEARRGCSSTLVTQETTSSDLRANQVDITPSHTSRVDALDTPLFNRDLTCLHLRITAYEKYEMENQAALSQLISSGTFHAAIAKELRAEQQMLHEGLHSARAELLRDHGVHHAGEAWTIGLPPCRAAFVSAPIDALGRYPDTHERDTAYAGGNAASSPARKERKKQHPNRQLVS